MYEVGVNANLHIESVRDKAECYLSGTDNRASIMLYPVISEGKYTQKALAEKVAETGNCRKVPEAQKGDVTK